MRDFYIIGRGKGWCRGRDLNPGHGLERPAYLAGLYYRGIRAAAPSTLSYPMFLRGFISVNPPPPRR